MPIAHTHTHTHTHIYIYIYIYIHIHIQGHLKKLNIAKTFFIFSCNLFQKVKFSHILDSMTASLRILSSKADSNTWESFTRSELKLESVHQESPYSDIFRKRATKPLLKQKHRQKRLTWATEKKNWTVAQWSKVLFSDESKCCISFGNQGPRVWRKCGEAQNASCLKSSVKFLKSQMIWGAVTSTGVDPLCFIKSKVNAAVYQEILEHFMLPSADKLYGDADFIFQQEFSTCPHC